MAWLAAEGLYQISLFLDSQFVKILHLDGISGDMSHVIIMNAHCLCFICSYSCMFYLRTLYS